MATRNSRSYSSRVSRVKSRKREKFTRPAKPIVDTSFTRHKGSTPRQMTEMELKSGGTIRRYNWLGLGRSSTRHKGLGIMKGTPEPGSEPDKNSASATGSATEYPLKLFGFDPQANNDPKTAGSLTPETQIWSAISPSDRPIPIGISIPSDSLPDFSPYQSTRNRSESDATLVTPSIVITPAAAMKSMWSPDTESDYTPGRSSSMYSRATFNMNSTFSTVPPVPALPANVLTSNAAPSGPTANQDLPEIIMSHARTDTIDSADTSFEEYIGLKHKERITSTGTLFEEDETPLRDRNTAMSNMSIDTAMVPNPRLSRGWWNVITTPFESRRNSVWTQGGRNTESLPDVPMVPQQYGATNASPSTPSTYIWSATEKKSHSTSMGNNTLTSPLSAMSASPVVGTAAIGTVLMPRQVQEHQPQPQPINITIELQDRRANVEAGPIHANSPPSTQTPQQNLSQAPQVIRMDLSTPASSTIQSPPPQFPPPPTAARKGATFNYDSHSRASSPVSTDLKAPKKHRKVADIMACLPFNRRNQGKNNEKKQDKKRRNRWCCACCCCLIIIVLLAIILPVTLVLTKPKDNPKPVDSPKGSPLETPSQTQWLNLTGYPPMYTGLSSIVQPEAVSEVSGCVVPNTMWSCAVPKEQQDALKPNQADQPNFIFNIAFDNETISDPSKTRPVTRAANPVTAGAIIRRLLNKRKTPQPSPAPPSIEDMRFLGNTTDKLSVPFEGEETPFFISIQDPFSKPASRRVKRQSGGVNNVTDLAPAPLINSDGTAAPANLYPLPSNQPLRLYNRGAKDEHYGFYVYFDRAIFMKNIRSNDTFGGLPADQNGGSPFDAADFRCTWAMTRYLVQIWTQSEATKNLLAAPNAKRPGTFPYPVTVTVDRHGGNSQDKRLYCYGMNENGTPNPKSLAFGNEDRTFQGNPINISNPGVKGTVDGGTGGCSCAWQNWF
ncbi:hypothetical protein P154DRAFT_467730 [Amniculicola lignicola CBS 123094]|uniref:Glycoprotease family protein n=1 Tax=Amniculicola lignicola CBS 123094 TaxID=1392246 RepID=A0A6A5WCZ4_9PLEO|nr:hypothetical protein P154DRAFT_467730 [Amniculicola lignicola CBS 123094]